LILSTRLLVFQHDWFWSVIRSHEDTSTFLVLKCPSLSCKHTCLATWLALKCSIHGAIQHVQFLHEVLRDQPSSCCNSSSTTLTADHNCPDFVKVVRKIHADLLAVIQEGIFFTDISLCISVFVNYHPTRKQYFWTEAIAKIHGSIQTLCSKHGIDAQQE
jgi:hypothetical protein